MRILLVGFMVWLAIATGALANNYGQCVARCASEQGMCISRCIGDGQCIAYCAESHGRCVTGCSME